MKVIPEEALKKIMGTMGNTTKPIGGDILTKEKLDQVAVTFGTSPAAQVAAKPDAAAELINSIAKLKSIEKSKIYSTSTLESLKIEPLDLLELATELEKLLGVVINDEKLVACKTVLEVYQMLLDLQKPKVEKEKEATQVAKKKIDEIVADMNIQQELPKKGKWKKNYEAKEASVDVSTTSLPADSKTTGSTYIGGMTPQKASKAPVIDHVVQVQKMLEEAGQANDFVVVPAGPYELQIDLDEPEDVVLFKERYAWLQKELVNILDLSTITFTRSKSMRWHVTITINKLLGGAEKLLLQLLLGSDPARELQSYGNMKKGHKNYTLLLERKEEWQKQKKITVTK